MNNPNTFSKQQVLFSLVVLIGVTAVAVSTSAAGRAQHDSGSATDDDGSATPIVANDNRRPAGTLTGNTLSLEFRAGVGLWHPNGEAAPGRRVEALGEGDAPLSVPAPLIRVTEGIEISARIRNDLDHPITVNGLCERGGAACPPIEIAAGETKSIRFRSGPAGTYHYWATTTGVPLVMRAADDAELSGAFVVDPAGAAPADDRILVITEWTTLTRAQLREVLAADDIGVAFLARKPEAGFVINGRARPHTERLTYRRGERVRWRIINLSTQTHPMHLHGFYFEVESQGDGGRDRVIPAAQRQSVVTQVMPPGTTMTVNWTPDRAGNWLLHCHVMVHVSSVVNLDGTPKHQAEHHGHDAAGAGMTGMVMGITVIEPTGGDGAAAVADNANARRVTLSIEAGAATNGSRSMGFRLIGADGQPQSPLTVPGPTLVLRRGEPVAITLVNKLPEATAIHWHGMELESYYDGVHGWGGGNGQVTPMIEPGASFVVRFTPPRAGTFMYHTHLHDQMQLTSGMYGAMLVVDSETAFDETTDHVFVIGRNGPAFEAPTVINGSTAPQIVIKAGLTHRLRLINITPGDIFSISLRANDEVLTWRPVAKDGADVPAERCQAAAAKQTIAVGETYDFAFDAPAGRRNLWLEVRSPAGKWHAQAQIIVK